MSKQTWASIVKKPVVSSHVQIPPIDYPDLLPTEVIVPEPPPPKTLILNTSITDSLSASELYGIEISKIQRRKEIVERDIQQKEEKFHTSYAYTRFSQDIDALNQQKRALDDKESEIKRAIILSTGTFAKRALEVIGRIKKYLGAEADYILRYQNDINAKMMYYSIECGGDWEFYWTQSKGNSEMNDGTGLKWIINESANVDYLFPNSVSIKFIIQKDDMIPILKAVIKSELKEFILDEVKN